MDLGPGIRNRLGRHARVRVVASCCWRALLYVLLPSRPNARADGSTVHETVLAGFGCGIGEFFECEQLSEVCAQKQRYTFFYV